MWNLEAPTACCHWAFGHWGPWVPWPVQLGSHLGPGWDQRP